MAGGIAASPLRAVEPASEEGTAASTPPPEPAPPPRTRVEVFPPEHLYAPYAADPIAPRFGVSMLGFTDASVFDSGDLRWALELGGRFGLLRWGPVERPFQLEITAGFRGWFDLEHSVDNLGWDGVYGLAVTTRRSPSVALKLAVRHVSSHVGDEYAERTGRRRIGYTREELQAGASWRPAERWRLYAEGAYAYKLSNADLQEAGRAQVGVEYAADSTLWRGRMGWYAAFNADAMGEREWEPDAAVQLGLAIPSGGRRWRLAATYATGRVPIGEFFQDEESYLGVGLYLDL